MLKRQHKNLEYMLGSLNTLNFPSTFQKAVLVIKPMFFHTEVGTVFEKAKQPAMLLLLYNML